MNPFRLLLFRLRSLILTPAFLVLLLALPVAALLIPAVVSYDTGVDDTVAAGYIVIDEDEEVVAFDDYADDIEAFTAILDHGNPDSLFSFKGFEDMNELRAGVVSGDLECAYVIPEDLFERMCKGDKKNLIPVLTSPKSSLTALVSETVYAAVFECVSGPIFLEYLKDDSTIADAIGDVISEEEVLSEQAAHQQDGSTFSFLYENTPKAHAVSRNAVLLSPLKGLLAVIILLAGFTGALTYYNAAENPLYARFSVRVVMILSPMLLSSLLAFLCIIFIPGLVEGNIFAELIRLIFYQLICLVFLLLITTLIKGRSVIYAFMPVYLLSCLIFSPVFIDLGQFIPMMRGLKWVFMSSFYLMK